MTSPRGFIPAHAGGPPSGSFEDLNFLVYLRIRLRSIPAHAGEPDRWTDSPAPSRGYPRTRGGTPRPGLRAYG